MASKILPIAVWSMMFCAYGLRLHSDLGGIPVAPWVGPVVHHPRIHIPRFSVSENLAHLRLETPGRSAADFPMHMQTSWHGPPMSSNESGSVAPEWDLAANISDDPWIPDPMHNQELSLADTLALLRLQMRTGLADNTPVFSNEIPRFASESERTSNISDDPMHMPEVPLADNLALLWSEMRAGLADNTPVSSNEIPRVAPESERTAGISDIPISDQTFPPAELYNIDALELLRNWVDPFMDPSADTNKKIASLYKNDGLTSPPKTLTSSLADKGMVLQKMRDVVLTASKHLDPTKQVELVGLIPKDLEMSALDALPEASVLALGAFSRGRLEDDSRGTLRNFVVSGAKDLRPGRWWQRLMGTGGSQEGDEHSAWQLEIFAIEGLADAPGHPGLSEHSARVLLCKIDEYAAAEKRIVVVSKRAYISSEGTDLTEYYVRLGFKKVVMSEGLHQLVYMEGGSHMKWTDLLRKESSWTEELSATERQQVMVGMNLQTKVDEEEELSSFADRLKHEDSLEESFADSSR